VVVANECGALADIAGAIAAEGSNIDELTMAQKTPQFREMSLHIEVRDREHLARILQRLKGLTTVTEAARTAH
jgi:(p)ppGpp synthase/HD superfamily hydrolase